MALPNFFIIGAAKAGTTSLYHYLREHPDIYLSPVKEPNYFSTDIRPEHFCNTYRKNTFLDVESYFYQEKLPDLQLTFIRKPEHYQKLFKDVTTEKAIGEASTSYLYSTVAAKNIKNYSPNASIIAILRNPVERAISHYLMALRYGHTKLPLRTALETDRKKEDKGWGISELFIELGMYYEQLKRYYDLFPEEHIQILLFEELTNQPHETLAKCQHFLNVAPLSMEEYHKHNKAQIPRFKKLNKFITDTGIKNIMKKCTPGPLLDKMKSTFFTHTPPVNEIAREDVDFLKEIYQTDIQNTSTLLNKDLTHWLNQPVIER